MRRIQFIELHDQPWMPEPLKVLFRDALGWSQRLVGAYRNAAPIVRRWLDRVGSDGYMDLCSGAGGPAAVLADALADAGERPKVRFSDLYPCIERYEELAQSDGRHYSYEPAPFNACDSTQGQPLRARTVLSAYHHFPPESARAILIDAVRNADGICVMEPFSRDLRHLMTIPMVAFLTPLFPFLSGRFSWTALTFCVLIPILFPVFLFDAAVSVARGYTPEELLALADDPACADFEWEAGHWRHLAVFKGTYLLGVRKKG